MKIRTILAAAAALSLTATPVIASAAAERTSAPVTNANEMGGDSTVLVSVLALAGLIAAVIIVADDDDEPVSA